MMKPTFICRGIIRVMKKYTDAQLLRFLEQEPQRGMVLLMESFIGLVWKVASLYLSNPEDVRECTNDVFAEFYFHMDSYDSEQASLAV